MYRRSTVVQSILYFVLPVSLGYGPCPCTLKDNFTAYLVAFLSALFFAMTSKDDTLRVPKLHADGSNWVTYRDRLRWALDARGILNHLETNIPEPIVKSPEELNAERPPKTPARPKKGADDPSTLDSPEEPTPVAKMVSSAMELTNAQWRSNEAAVKQCIASTVPDSVFNRVKTKTLAREVWGAVVEIFEGRSYMLVVDLKKKMQGIRCGDNDNVRTHFDKLAEMYERLSSMGTTLEAPEYTSTIISSLPSIYDPTISSIIAAASLAQKKPDPETIIKLVTDDYDRRTVNNRIKPKKDEKDAAFHAGGGTKGDAKEKKKNAKCHNCQKTGHYKSECWAKGGGKEGQGPKGKGGPKGNEKKGEKASVAEAEDAVWSVVDEGEGLDEMMGDDRESMDLYMLEVSNEDCEETEDSPEVIDADPETADRLKSILLQPPMPKNDDDVDSLPGLQSATQSSIATGDLQYPDNEDMVEGWERLNDALASNPAMEIDEGEERGKDDEGETSSYTAAVLTGNQYTRKSGSELYDSGASRHMTPFRDRLLNFTSIPSRPITAADKRIFHATGKGDLQIEIPNGKTTTRTLLKDVLYAPDMGLTIVSISRITAAGFSVWFRSNHCRIYDPKDRQIGQVYVTANGLYRVDHGDVAGSASHFKPRTISLKDLHARLGHISPTIAKKLVKEGMVKGVVLGDDRDLDGICESCEYSKATRKVIKKERQDPLAPNFGDEVHSDLWGPSPTETIGKRQYYVSFTDDHTRWTHLDLLRTKDETFRAYKNYEAWVHTQQNARIKRLHSDRGGEYLSDEFTNYLKSKGTERRLTIHDTPQHNGVAESLNGRLLERV